MQRAQQSKPKAPLKDLPKENMMVLKASVESIRKTNYMVPIEKPNKEWRVFYGDTIEEAWTKAKDAAYDMAESEDQRINGIMFHGLDMSTAAAEKASRQEAAEVITNLLIKEVSNKLQDYIEPFIFETVADAAFHGHLIATMDLDFPLKESTFNHSKKRMEVWEKGYGLFGEVKGELFVFAVREKLELPVDLRDGSRERLSGRLRLPLVAQEALAA